MKSALPARKPRGLIPYQQSDRAEPFIFLSLAVSAVLAVVFAGTDSARFAGNLDGIASQLTQGMPWCEAAISPNPNLLTNLSDLQVQTGNSSTGAQSKPPRMTL